MAEPVIPPLHPLAQYLHETLEDEPDDELSPFPGHLPWPTQPLTQHPLARLALHHLTPLLSLLLPYLTPSPAPHPISERLKFLVISSPLLNAHLPSAPTVASLPSTPSVRAVDFASPTQARFAPPGRMPERPTSRGDTQAADERGVGGAWAWALLGTLLAVLVGSGTLFVLLQGACLLWSIMNARGEEEAERPETLSSVLDSVSGLVTAAEQWDTTVSEALALLETEETNVPFDPVRVPASPTSSLRTLLREVLHDTASRSETVRSLLSPLSSSAAIRQLGEMYAPSRDPEPATLLSPRRRVMSPAPAASPTTTPTALHRRPASLYIASKPRRGRPSVSGIGLNQSFSVPAGLRDRAANHATRTPLTSPRARDAYARLPHTPEDGPGPVTPPYARAHSVTRTHSDNHLRRSYTQTAMPLPTSPAPLASTSTSASFSLSRISTLDLDQAFPRPLRRHRSQTLSLSPALLPSLSGSPTPTPTSTSTLRRAHQPQPQRRASIAQRLRNPLSLPALSASLHSALQARRWAAAHLLALRFEPEDEYAATPGALPDADADGRQAWAYWDDVGSVVHLWAGSLAELTLRLRGAVDDAQARVDELGRQPLTPLPGTSVFSLSSPLSIPLRDLGAGAGAGFAPVPSPMARFLDRTTALASALEDMRAQLGMATGALRAWSLGLGLGLSSAGAHGDADGEALEDPLAAYDALRPLVASVLREYERGRADLLAVLRVRRGQGDEDQDDRDGEAEAEEVPALSGDHSSASGSEEHVASPPAGALPLPMRVLEAALARSPLPHDPDADPDADPDHGRHALDEFEFDFALPGIEQVFEESGTGGAFERERSKLSREERIARARAEREGGQGALATPVLSASTSASAGASVASFPATPTPSAHASPALVTTFLNGRTGFGPAPTPVPRPERAGSRERWGPSGEVVQELKDVIMRVGQRRQLALVERQRAGGLARSPTRTHTPSSSSALSRPGSPLSPKGQRATLPLIPIAPVTPPFSPPSRVLDAAGLERDDV